MGAALGFGQDGAAGNLDRRGVVGVPVLHAPGAHRGGGPVGADQVTRGVNATSSAVGRVSGGGISESGVGNKTRQPPQLGHECSQLGAGEMFGFLLFGDRQQLRVPRFGISDHLVKEGISYGGIHAPPFARLSLFSGTTRSSGRLSAIRPSHEPILLVLRCSRRHDCNQRRPGRIGVCLR
jgi:hypothetical protein